ncbi:hypothetical protein ES705_20789 [subsurface metagenome]
MKINVSGVSYRSAGWNTQANGNGTDYASGSTFSMGNANVTLYAKWIAYALRDTGPAGGLIFYINPNYETDGWRYLEAAPNDQDGGSGKVWSNITNTQIGTTSTAIGTGQANTDAIMGQAGFTDGAAKLCDVLVITTGGGLYPIIIYSNWFLPSKDELNQMYVNLKSQGAGGFADKFYWSSSEYGANYAWSQSFLSGLQLSSFYKYSTSRVRAVRAF